MIHNKNCIRLSIHRAVLCIGVFGVCKSVDAAVTLDGTLGAAPPLAGPDYVIPAEVGQIRGANLFHSFGEFGLAGRESATFTGPRDVQNIIGRVTGGEASRIDGSINSAIFGANLYLINPSGVTFGPNARLDVSGSFYASTADYLRLADGGRFDARNPSASNLTVAPVAAFGFLGGGTAAPIAVAGSLSVPAGQTLGLIGGDLAIDGNQAVLDAASGRIDLVAVRSAGELMLSLRRPDTPDVSVFDVLGDIFIGNGATVSTAGDPGGTIYIRGGRLTMEGAALDSSTVGAADHTGVGIDIAVRGEFLLSVSEDVNARDGLIESSSFDVGRAGDIRIEAGSFRLAGNPARGRLANGLFARIASSGLGSGRGGDIALDVNDLELGPNASIATESFGTGDAGDIIVNADSLQVNGTSGEGSFISSSAFDAGNAGSLTISASDVLLQGSNNGSLIGLIISSQFSTGALTLTTGHLRILDGATILTSNGNIHITANDILIAGDANSSSTTGIFSSAVGEDVSQDAGNIVVNTGNLIMSRNGEISTSVDTGFGSRTGNIQITAGNMELGSGARVSSLSSGRADTHIDVSAKRLLLVGGGGGHFDEPEGGTDAGIIALAGARGGASVDIQIDSLDLQVLGGARIDASTVGIVGGGSIGIRSDRVLVAGRGAESGAGSSITAVSNGTGNSGNIDIAAKDVVVHDHGVISVASRSRGNAGNLRIAADSISLTDHAEVSVAASMQGVAGNLEIIARDVLTMRDSQINAYAVNSSGGTIDIQAGALIDLHNSSITSSLLASLPGSVVTAGDIRIAADLISLSDNSLLSATATGNGHAGNIEVNAHTALRMQNSAISTDSELNSNLTVSAHSNISIVARSLVYLNNSAITSSAHGSGNGGNIAIDPDFVVLNHSRIAANAFGGTGGNVTIVAGNFFASTDSSVTASSTLGLQGNVVIRAPTQDLSGDLEQLPETAVDASILFKSRCTAVGSRFSSFTVAGPSGAPVAGYMPSSYIDIDAAAAGGPVARADAVPQPNSILARATPTLPIGCRQ